MTRVGGDRLDGQVRWDSDEPFGDGVSVGYNRLEGSVNLVGHGEKIFGADEGTRVLAGRAARPDLSPDPDLPDDTRLWAALQQAGGGTWGGCVYDVDAIAAKLNRS